MPEPTATLQALRASTADLVHELDTSDWSDADVSVASLCDGWTRGHVLTHLARNADGIAATLAGAVRGEIVGRYPDGWDARNTAIEQGSSRAFLALATDVRDSAARLERVFGAVGDADAWDRATDQGRPAQDWVFWRLREVEIHRVDLDRNYLPSQWPAALVAELVPTVVASLAERMTAPIRVTVTGSDCVVPDLVGFTWACNESSTAPTTHVSGPDWAVLAWLVGRGSIVAGALTAVPPVGPWR